MIIKNLNNSTNVFFSSAAALMIVQAMLLDRYSTFGCSIPSRYIIREYGKKRGPVVPPPPHSFSVCRTVLRQTFHFQNSAVVRRIRNFPSCKQYYIRISVITVRTFLRQTSNFPSLEHFYAIPASFRLKNIFTLYQHLFVFRIFVSQTSNFPSSEYL